VAGPGDFAAAMERMRKLRAGISKVDGAPRYRDLGVDVFLGEGRFTSRDAILVDGKVLRFRRAIIATGARAAAPPVPGLEQTGFLTNETIFSLTELPRHLLVLGAGPIGCEMAQAFARFGTHPADARRQAPLSVVLQDGQLEQAVDGATTSSPIGLEPISPRRRYPPQ